MHAGLADLPVILAAMLMILLIPALAIAGLFLLRRHIGFEALVVNNEVAGFKYATMGVAYAVLATFVLVSVWEKYEEAEAAVAAEATAMVKLFRLAETLPAGDESRLQGALGDYLNHVIAVESPQMREGRTSHEEGARLLDALGQPVFAVASVEAVPPPVLDNLLAAYADVIDARRARIDAADGSLPDILWWLVVLGGLITIGFTFFFASPNILAQAAMTGLLGIIIMSLVFTTVMMNHPFVGDIAVGLGAYEEVRQLMAADPH